MAILNKRIRAFSLVEVLVAMVIIMVVFGLGITITLNVFASNGLERHMQARLALDAYIAETVKHGRYIDNVEDMPPYKVECTVTPHEVAKGLIKVAFVVKSEDGKLLLTEERWVWLP